MYEERTYRRLMKSGLLQNFTVMEDESDLHISADCRLDESAREVLSVCRRQLKAYIGRHPSFFTSLVPVEVGEDAPKIAKKMAAASRTAGVGPMAAVAGAIAEAVGMKLLLQSKEVLVENGGDLFLKIARPVKVMVHAGTSPFSGKLALSLLPTGEPLGICTSSGKIGHSLSFGKADAVVALSRDTALADAAATAICNRVRSVDDIESALAWGKSLPGIIGILVVIDDRLGTWGDIVLTQP